MSRPLARTMSLPVRRCLLKPNVPRQPGVKGGLPLRRRRHFDE